MSPKAPESQELGETLTRHYRLACELCNTYPVGRYTHQFSQANLHINLAEIEPEQLEAICYTLNNKVTPVGINFYIPNKRDVEVRIIQRLITGLSSCLLQSISLKTLQLQNIDIKGKLLSSLCKALSKTKKLSYFSLIHCEIGDAGTEQICQAIKNVPSLFHLTLVGCQITEKGAKAVSKLIQHQSLNRDSAMWQDTLRVGQPILDDMRGLRRVTLSLNPQLGDEGVICLCQVLKEDLWIKAIDLHHCGVSNESGKELLSLVKLNQTLEVVDIRQNPFLDQNLIHSIIAALSGRSQEYATHHYEWLPILPEDQFPIDASAAVAAASINDVTQLSSNASRCTGDRTRRRNNTTHLICNLGTNQQIFTKKPQMPEKPGIPWRVEQRIYERKEGLAPGSSQDVVKVPRSQIELPDTQIKKISSNDDTAGNQGFKLDDGKYISLHQIRKLLTYYKKKCHKERDKRKKLEKKYAALHEKLSSGHLFDEVSITHIETCFMRFQEFLNHLRYAGYEWQKQILKETMHDVAEKRIGSKEKYKAKESPHRKDLITKHREMNSNSETSQSQRATSARVSHQKRFKNEPAEVCNIDLPPSVIPIPIIVEANSKKIHDDSLNTKIQESKSQVHLYQQKCQYSYLNSEMDKNKELEVVVPENDIGIKRKQPHPSLYKKQENIIKSLHRELEIGKELLNKRSNESDIDHELKEKFKKDKDISESDNSEKENDESDSENDNDCSPSVVELSGREVDSKEHIYGKGIMECPEKNVNESNESFINPESSSISIEVTLSSEDNQLQGITITSLQDQEEPEIMESNRSNIVAAKSDIVCIDLKDQMLSVEQVESPVLISLHLEEVETSYQSDIDEKENSKSHNNIGTFTEENNVESYESKFSTCQNSSNSNVELTDKKLEEIGIVIPIKAPLKQEKVYENIIISNEASETDDEKLKHRRTSISSLIGRNASACSYSSISDQLSQSHNRWTKKKINTQKDNLTTPNNSTTSSHIENLLYEKIKDDESFKKLDPPKDEVMDIDTKRIAKESSPKALVVMMPAGPGGNEYGSDFEVSDIEGLSISASSLTSTSINDALSTQADDNF